MSMWHIKCGESLRKCDVWVCSDHTSRRWQQIAISCKRSDYKIQKTCQSFTMSNLVRKRLQHVALFCNAAHSTSSEVIDFDEFMSSTSGHSTATVRYWMKKTTNAISDTGKKESVHIALLQIHSEDGAFLLVLLGSLIGVSSVHFCQMCSARCTSFSYISRTPQVMDDNWSFSVPTRPSRWTSPRSNQFWVANHVCQVFLEAIVNSLKFVFDTSPPRIMGCEVLLLCLSFTVPSTTRSSPLNDSSGIERASNRHWWRCRLDSLSLQEMSTKCNKLFLDSNKEGILSIAPLGLFRVTQIALRCPCHESSSLIFHWMGCRHYFVADRLEDLVDDSDSRSSSRVREHGSFRLVSPLHVAIQTLWSRCLFPHVVWTNR